MSPGLTSARNAQQKSGFAVDVQADRFNLKHLRAFCAVAESGSISKASKSVFLSQPAITQAILKLERTIGASLFERSTSGMSLTQSGTIFFERSRRALDYVKKGIRLATHTQLRSLIATVDAGSMTLAASNLNVSPAALHHSIRELERTCGVEFFKRIGNGIWASPQAAALARFGHLAYSELSSGCEETKYLLGQGRTSIRVGATPIPRAQLLPSAIKSINRAMPNVLVSVVDGPYPDLLRGLQQGTLDMIVGALPPQNAPDGLTQERLFSDRLVIVGQAGHPLANKDNVTLEELASCCWAVPRVGTPTRNVFEQMFSTCAAEFPKRHVETSSLILIRGLLDDSDRLTLISGHQVEHELQSGQFERINFNIEDLPRQVGVVTRDDWAPTTAQSRFIEMLRQAAPNQPNTAIAGAAGR